MDPREAPEAPGQQAGRGGHRRPRRTAARVPMKSGTNTADGRASPSPCSPRSAQRERAEWERERSPLMGKGDGGCARAATTSRADTSSTACRDQRESGSTPAAASTFAEPWATLRGKRNLARLRRREWFVNPTYFSSSRAGNTFNSPVFLCYHHPSPPKTQRVHSTSRPFRSPIRCRAGLGEAVKSATSLTCRDGLARALRMRNVAGRLSYHGRIACIRSGC